MMTDGKKTSLGILLKLCHIRSSNIFNFPQSGYTHKSGCFINKPKVGCSFIMVTENGPFATSFVVKIIEEDKNKILFNTRNSTYQLSINLFEDID